MVQVELVEPPAGAAVGERLSVEGYDCSQPDAQLNPKKKIVEAVSAAALRFVRVPWLGMLHAPLDGPWSLLCERQAARAVVPARVICSGGVHACRRLCWLRLTAGAYSQCVPFHFRLALGGVSQ
jgi:hypothetical protein